MIAELRQAHTFLRADLVVLERALAMLSDVAADHDAVPEMVDGLTVANLAWQLRVKCDYYCNHLTPHHTVEDVRMFPRCFGDSPNSPRKLII